MTAEVMTDTTETTLALTYPLVGDSAAVATFWQGQEPTQGYAPHFNTTNAFIWFQGSLSHTYWVQHTLDLDILDVGLFWSLPATAHEVIIDPSMIDDLVNLRQQRLTSYRFSFTDALKTLRGIIASRLVLPVLAAEESPRRRDVPDHAWVEQLTEIKQLSELTNDQLAQLFDVSRTSVQGWLAGGGMRSVNRKHLRQIVPILRDAYQRHQSSQQLHELLMTPVGEKRRRVFDYLMEKDYEIARGYLQHRRATKRQRLREPIKPKVQLSEADRLDSLEQLSPSPRAVTDHE